MTLEINDSATWRTAQQVQVNDAGTWRTIQDIKVNDAGTWRTVYTAITELLNTTMTVGHYDDGLGNVVDGFSTAFAIGSLGNATLTTGAVTVEMYDFTSSVYADFVITIGADPGASYFSSIVLNGVTKTSASATYLGFAGGQANWRWASLFSLSGSGTVGFVINP